VLDPRFPAQYDYALVHFVRWRRYMVAGGSGKLAQANWERDRFDEAVFRLRNYARAVDQSRPARLVHALEVRRPRLARDVDASRS
jgi:hypothetical protein